MEKNLIAKRYALGFYKALEDKNKVDKGLNLLREMVEFFKTNQPVFFLLYTPIVKREDKLKLLDMIFKDIDPLLKNFLVLLIKYSRMDIIEEIFHELEKIYYRKENKILGTLKTVIKVDKDIVKQIEEKVSSILEKNIVLKNIEDKSILGGFKIEIGSLVIEVTIKSQLDKLRNLEVNI